MILELNVLLVGWREDGRPLSAAEFAEPLGIEKGDGRLFAGTRKWESTRYLLAHAAYQLPNSVEASESFDRAIAGAWNDSAAWLGARAPDLFDGARSAGAKLELLLDFRMNDDQMELSLPPELLERLGSRRLRLHVISND